MRLRGLLAARFVIRVSRVPRELVGEAVGVALAGGAAMLPVWLVGAGDGSKAGRLGGAACWQMAG